MSERACFALPLGRRSLLNLLLSPYFSGNAWTHHPRATPGSSEKAACSNNTVAVNVTAHGTSNIKQCKINPCLSQNGYGRCSFHFAFTIGMCYPAWESYVVRVMGSGYAKSNTCGVKLEYAGAARGGVLNKPPTTIQRTPNLKYGPVECALAL